MQESSKTISAITDFLFIGKPEEELSFYDLVILLGNDDITGNVNALINLYDKKHFDDKSLIIISGNVGSLNSTKSPEAHRMFNLLKGSDFPMDRVIVEDKSTNALENFKYSLLLISKVASIDSFSKILCIGRAFMGRRAIMSASACGYPIESIDYYGTVDRQGKNIGPDSWWKSEPAKIRVLEELKRISEYTLKGDISIY